MPDIPRIVVFEDKDKNYDLFAEALHEEVQDEFEIMRYDGKRRLSDNAKWSDAEHWVRAALLEPTPAIVAVIDWDLTQFDHPAPQQFIRGISEDLAIPTMLYQSDANAEKKLERLRRWQERRIAIEGTQDQVKIAGVCADVARGFRTIRERVSSLDQPKLLDTLRELLNPPTDAPLHLEQFAIGNQELLRVTDKDPGPEYKRFIATWIGYLLYNRVLEFPGPIVKGIAAAAYLGIAKEEMRARDVQLVLEDARYTGPFSAAGLWWVTGLDALIAKNTKPEDRTVPIGRVVLERVLQRPVAHARCHDGEELNEQAFLCVLTHDVVCRRHSDAPEAWIPQGADLCRIHIDEFEALRAWLGI